MGTNYFMWAGLGVLMGGGGTLIYRGAIEDHPPTKFLLGKMGDKYSLTTDGDKFSERAKIYNNKPYLHIPDLGDEPVSFDKIRSKTPREISGEELRWACQSLKGRRGLKNAFAQKAHWMRFQYWCTDEVKASS